MRAFLGLVVAAVVGCASSGWQGGIHARMGWSQANGLRVIEVPPKSPASDAGLRPGDRIMTIDGWSVEGRSMNDVRQHLRGDVGTYTTLGIQRNNQPLTLRIERAPYAER